MALKDVLVKLKLVEPETPGPAAPEQQITRSRQSIEEILRDVEPVAAERFEGLSRESVAHGQDRTGGAGATPMRGEEVPGFPEIYRAAGVEEPAHGFTAFKVLEILSSPDFAGLPPKAKAAALGGFLKMNPAGPVAISSVIQDAVRRDQALDKFEEFLRSRLSSAAEAVERENAKLQAEVDDLVRRHREAIEENRRRLDGERSRLDAWLERKRAEEARLHAAVEPFVEENPVSRTGTPGGTN